MGFYSQTTVILGFSSEDWQPIRIQGYGETFQLAKPPRTGVTGVASQFMDPFDDLRSY